MNSENSKEKKNTFKASTLLRILMAGIFLSAGIFRVFNQTIAAQELIDLHLPLALSYLLIVLEICAGLALLFGKYLKQICLTMISFLSFALIWGLIINGRGMMHQAQELFVYQTTPTDFFLHLVFLVILAFIFLNSLKEG